MTWFANVVLSLTGTLVLVVVFVLPALEASTPLGIVVPGELAVILGGVLAQLGRLPLWAVVVAGAAEAVVGDSAGYAVGRRLGDGLLARLPRAFVLPGRVERAKSLVRRLGGRGGRSWPLHRGVPDAGTRPRRDRRNALPHLRGVQRRRWRAVGDRRRPART